MQIKAFYEDQEIGRLEAIQGLIAFQYNPAFLNSQIELSPIALPLRREPYFDHPPFFENLPGLFYDSLPDSWGRKLMDENFRRQGLLLEKINPLLRLSYVGSRGPGAIIYQPDSGFAEEEALNLIELERASRAFLKGEPQSVISKLFQVGGTAGGARPKAWIGLKPDTEEICSGVVDLPQSYEPWLVKFDNKPERQWGKIEYAYHLMAKEAGIICSDIRLLKTESEEGERYHFANRRFDREGNRRIHVHTLAAMTHKDFSARELDYTDFLTVVRAITRDQREVTQAFRRAVFNILSCNLDDHAKNHAFRYDKGEWKLTPCYDLCYVSPSVTNGFRQMPIFGKGINIDKNDLIKLAEKFEVDRKIIDEIAEVIKRWPEYASRAGVNNERTQEIDIILSEIREKFGQKN